MAGAEMAEMAEMAEDAAAQGGEERPEGAFAAVGFGGNGREYFGIWIVNLLLSILTLGVYSAWAKVRTNRYFYGHLQVGGHGLRYLANPVQILIGRVIGVALFGGYFALSLVDEFAGAVVALALMFLAPWLACLSIRFNLRMTAWRNVRFGFGGTYGPAFMAFVVYPFLGLLTLFILMPWALKKMDEFIYRNVSYGNRPLACNVRMGAYFGAVFGAFLFVLVAAWGVLVVGIIAGGMPANPDEGGQPSPWLAAAFLPIYLLAYAIYTAILRNHLFNRTFLPGLVDFESRVGALSLFWLLLTNGALLIGTLGLALPWVRVRTARYYADATSIRVSDGIEKVIAQMPPETSAIGEEVAGIFDMDVGLT